MRDNYVVANSPTTPADKFLIIPVGVQWIEYEKIDIQSPMVIIFWP
jgi:hypothetical protein